MTKRSIPIKKFGAKIGLCLRWGAFYAPGSRYALALQPEWGRLQRARSGAVTAADLPTPPTKTALGASASAFGHKVGKLHRAIFNEIRSYRNFEI